MKGKYNGRHMTIYGTLLPGARTIAWSSALTDKLTEQAKHRIKILDWHKAHGKNISLTARHFGIGRITLHRWLKRFERMGVIGLNEYSRKPKNARRPATPWSIVSRVVELRKQYPAWSKHKLAAILKREGLIASASTVGRVLKRKGLIDKKISAKRKRSALHPKARFPKGLRINQEGQMIQMDTKYIMLPGGHKFYQFTAIDVLGKKRVLRVYPSQSSRNGALFLKDCIASFPFPVRAVQTDNGSPFLKEFDKLCKKLGLPHYFTYPRSPKQNSYVENSHGSDEREFYRYGGACSILSEMQKNIKEREDVWNNFRPHETLGQLTPAEYSNRIKLHGLPTKNVIVLQTQGCIICI
jgi:transposase InsO family protein